ncbi:CU044_2847 family protein [Vibrio coralliirubri]|uniref:CU044_2847 family protein n=1 Tax=Vibrio coralliirubri TaxID=1516159 RepID=UPI00073F628F|nr:CU044_2847 family protein [Vibrio coralliirubri]
MSKIIKVSDALEVEVELREGEISEISSHENMNSSLDQINILLTEVTRPVTDAFQTLSEKVYVESTKVTVGVKFGASGNIFVAKSSAEANISVEMTIRPKND